MEGDHLHNLGVDRNILFYSIVSLTFFFRGPLLASKNNYGHTFLPI